MEMMYYQLGRVSYQDSLQVLEADIQHANAMAAKIPTAKGGTRLQMKLVYNQMAPIILFLLQWMDCSCTCLLPRYFNLFHVKVYQVCENEKAKISRYGRKASVRDFYSVILPSLQRLHGDLALLEKCSDKKFGLEFVGKKKLEHSFNKMEMDREDECGICLEPCTKMVLPNCCHSMCIIIMWKDKEILAVGADWVSGISTPLGAEGRALLMGMMAAQQKGLHRATFLSDSCEIVEAVMKGRRRGGSCNG